MSWAILPREPEDGPFARGHVQLGVRRAAFLGGEEQVLAAAGQVDDLGVPEREHLLGELDLRRRQGVFLGRRAQARHAEHAAHLGRIAEIAERPEVDGPRRLGRVPAAEEAAVPALRTAPAHGPPAVRCRVVELDDDLALLVLASAEPGAVVGEERRRHEVLHARSRHLVGARGREEDRRLAACVAAGDDAHGIVENHPDAVDAANAPQMDLGQEMRQVRLLALQPLPEIPEPPLDHERPLSRPPGPSVIETARPAGRLSTVSRRLSKIRRARGVACHSAPTRWPGSRRRSPGDSARGDSAGVGRQGSFFCPPCVFPLTTFQRPVAAIPARGQEWPSAPLSGRRLHDPRRAIEVRRIAARSAP